MENRKSFLDDLAKKLNIKKPSDWGSITAQHVHELGGGTLISTYYKESLFRCLQSVYKGKIFTAITQDIEWKRDWFVFVPRFPKTHWSIPENSRQFMDDVAISSNIRYQSDWRKVSLAVIRNRGGRVIYNRT